MKTFITLMHTKTTNLIIITNIVHIMTVIVIISTALLHNFRFAVAMVVLAPYSRDHTCFHGLLVALLVKYCYSSALLVLLSD